MTYYTGLSKNKQSRSRTRKGKEKRKIEQAIQIEIRRQKDKKARKIERKKKKERKKRKKVRKKVSKENKEKRNEKKCMCLSDVSSIYENCLYAVEYLPEHNMRRDWGLYKRMRFTYHQKKFWPGLPPPRDINY